MRKELCNVPRAHVVLRPNTELKACTGVRLDKISRISQGANLE